MKIIDTHCHPQLAQYDADRDQVIKRALDAGIQMICVGIDLETSRQAVALAERYEGLWASVGLHPNDVDQEFSIGDFQKLLEHPKVVAIGEVGLDYYRTSEPEKQKLQRQVLAQFIDLARENKKPLIIHCRDAHNDMLEMLPEYSGVIHSFTGTLEQAQAYIKKGYLIGLNGIITFARQYDEVIRGIPLERILLETDSPFLTPVPYRGKRNEPVYIQEVASMIAKIRGISIQEVVHATTNNSENLFMNV